MVRKLVRAIKPMFQRCRWRIFVGDTVVVNHGPHRSQSGRVLQVIQDKQLPQVVVEGVNLRKKKVPTEQSEEGFYVVTVEAPIHYSQVSLVEPALTDADALIPPLQRAVRAKFRYLADGTRTRIGKGPGASPSTVLIPIPPPPASTVPLNTSGPLDTEVAAVLEPSSAADDFQTFKRWADSRIPAIARSKPTAKATGSESAAASH